MFQIGYWLYLQSFKSLAKLERLRQNFNFRPFFDTPGTYLIYFIGEKMSGTKSDEKFERVTKFFPNKLKPRYFNTRPKCLPDFFIPNRNFYPKFYTSTKNQIQIFKFTLLTDGRPIDIWAIFIPSFFLANSQAFHFSMST